MVKRPKLSVLVLLGATMSVGVGPQLWAATTSTIDVLPVERDGSDSVDVGGLKPLAEPGREPAKPLPSGNPLWSVPLSALTATVGRPLFSASRRPPQGAVAGPPVEPVAAPAPVAAEPERPALALIGAVVGDNDAIAVFLDRTTQKTIRLRQGDTHAGWQLSAVQGREVTFERAGRSEVLALQRPEGAGMAPSGGPPLPPVAGLAVPQPQPQLVPGALDGSYAPFTPRSTPKNGESDGL
ncbi:hypothetical protein [Bradyrhizobium ivorense]|uniref:hypothetical protein n=1 Tax=Bradyrhizobium ivorense TaxID=2511166 RepID=UPI0010B33099|nr:hypothetical protein [Bradyrhizobium ivorense]VIO77481.1 hypothetical protein CI41S_57370 [Bradyrhizobium ivorense]